MKNKSGTLNLRLFMLKGLVNELAKELEMKEEIVSEDDQHFRLSFDHGTVDATEMKECILLKGAIGEKPKKNSDAFLMRVMEANLFGIGTRGGMIGLKEKQLTLIFELDPSISYKDFKEKLEDFISVKTFWQNESLKHE